MVNFYLSREAPFLLIYMKFDTDVITHIEFLIHWFRVYGVLAYPKLLFPLDNVCHPHNSVTCYTVIQYRLRYLLWSFPL